MEPKTKGTDIISLRKLVEAGGPRDETAFLKSLSAETLAIYNAIVPISWTSITSQTEIYEAAMRVLFPDSKKPARDLGFAMAQKSYSTVYRFFMRIPSVNMIIKQAALIWRTYYDHGDAKPENAGKGCCDFVVANFPELTHTLRETVAGHILALVGMTGAKNITVEHVETDPAAWVWKIRWQ